MSNTWITSDWHVGHRNIIRYCGRPTNCDELILKSLSIMKEEDVLIHLGDFGFYGTDGKIENAFSTIPCKEKILIVGNHDEKNRKVLKLPWSKIVKRKEQPYYFTYKELVITAQHRPYREYPRKVHAGRWLLQKITDMFLDIKERGRLGSFLHYQQVPEDAHIALHGHSHEIGQRYDWSDGTLLVNVCVEQFDYHPVSLVELEQEYYARKVYMETKR